MKGTETSLVVGHTAKSVLWIGIVSMRSEFFDHPEPDPDLDPDPNPDPTKFYTCWKTEFYLHSFPAVSMCQSTLFYHSNQRRRFHNFQYFEYFGQYRISKFSEKVWQSGLNEYGLVGLSIRIGRPWMRIRPRMPIRPEPDPLR
jgi:hypothetical protein